MEAALERDVMGDQVQLPKTLSDMNFSPPMNLANQTSSFMNSSNSTGNLSGTPGPIQPSLTFETRFKPFTICVGTIANIWLLWLYYKRPTMRTPFGMYLINLILTDTLMSCLWQPILYANQLSVSWTLGYHACAFRQYVAWTLNATLNVSHCLIALNRFWAVSFPVSYRSSHNTKVACITCALSWLAVNICTIPIVIVNARLTPPSSKGVRRCILATDPIGISGAMIQIFLYDLSIVVIILLYPVIFYKSFAGTKSNRRVRAGNSNSRSLTRQVTNQSTGANSSAANGSQGGPQRPSISCCRRPQYGSTLGFVTLTLTTLSALVCLAPNEVFYTVLVVFNYEPPGLGGVRMLQLLAVIFDPILIVLANPELRKLVRERFAFC